MTTADNPIAVVGIGCRFPPAVTGPAQFWSFLLARGDAVREIPADRWRWESFFDPDPAKPGKATVARGAFLDQRIDELDASFFGVAPVEAEQLDPQQRLVLEVAWEALEDAGHDVWALRGSRTGVYMGAFTLDNMLQRTEPDARDDIGPQTAMTCTPTVLSSRLAYVFDLRGPCMTIDTACSSSLVAVHQACRALEAGDCDLALAGGVNRIFRPETHITMSKGHFLAPDGRSKSFSASADGYGRGEGCGVVVLKRLADAVRDGDRVYAVVERSGVNQDGRTEGMALPSPAAQAELIEAVSRSAGVDPATIGYVEAHGTGTFVGDPAEMCAIGTVIGRAPGRRGPCVVGSVKAGIGHLEGAAGVAGFVKAVLVAHHRVVPPQAWLDELNPAIDFAGLGLRVPTEATPLGGPDGQDGPDRPVRVAVNSFGYGGTNAHALVREAPATPSPTSATHTTGGRYPPVVLLSGHATTAVEALAADYAGLVRETPDPAERRRLLAAFAGRTAHEHRRAVVGEPSSHADVLDVLAAGGRHPDLVEGRAAGNRPVDPAFVFSGMGPQWWAMGRELLEGHDGFRAHAERCDATFRRLAGWSLVDELLAPEDASRMASTEVAQPANVVLQTGLARVLAELGVRPGAVVGHSVGEVAAAHVAGVLDLDDALRVAFHRSRLQAKTAGTGGMVATELGADDAAALVASFGPGVSIAAVNGPSATTIAGDVDVLAVIERELSDRDVFCRRVRVEVAYHSPAMDPILGELRAALAGIGGRPGEVPLYSTVDASFDGGGWGAGYWADNARRPVSFAPAIERMTGDGHRVFVEIGAHPVLGLYIRQLTAAARDVAVVGTLHRDWPDHRALVESAARLWSVGVPVDWAPVLGRERAASLPTYPWQRERLWQESAPVRRRRTGETDHPDVLHGAPASTTPPVWDVDLSPTSVGWCRQHVVDGAPVFPAAGYVEALVSHARALAGDLPVVLEDLTIESPLVLGEHDDPVLRLAFGEDGRVTLAARRRGDPEGWRTHGRARIGRGPYVAPRPLDPAPGGLPVDVDDVYRTFDRLGLDYQGPFRSIARLARTADGVVAEIGWNGDRDGPGHAGYTLYPPALDATVHALMAVQDLDDARLYLPVRLRRVVVRRALPPLFMARAAVRRDSPERIEADIDLLDPDGELVAALRGLELQVLQRDAGRAAGWLDGVTYAPAWQAVEAPAPRPHAQPRAWLVVGAGGGRDGGTGELAAALRSDVEPVRAVTERAGVGDVGDGDLRDVDAVAVALAPDGPDDVDASIEAAGAVLGLVQRIDALPPDRRPRELVLVTRDALAVLPDDRAPGWLAGWIVGFRRCLANERDHFRARHVDHDGGDMAALVAAVAGTDGEELALRAGRLHTPVVDRLRARSRQDGWWSVAPRRPAGEVESFTLARTGRSLQDFTWVATERRPPGPGEVELRVEAVGLNYKDVLKQLGVISDAVLARTFTGTGIGFEQCVVVDRVGDGVTRLEPGQRLLATLPGGFGRYLTVEATTARLAPVPHGWTHVEAAGQLIAYLTAHRAIAELGRLTPGETLLVHSGTGAVGLAALGVGRALGARILATAGTPAKRALLGELGVEAVFDSRSLDFTDHVLAATGGRGVDVVLNTLPGDGLRANLQITAEDGRLVEISKGEIGRGGALPLDLFDKNVSFVSFDLDHLAKDHRRFQDLVDRVFEQIDAGRYRPVPVTAYPAARVSEAFSLLGRAGHVGKVVVDLADTDGLRCAADPALAQPVRPDRSYLVTGGTGGLGPEIARWLADRGARRLALVSRRAQLAPPAAGVVDELRARGVDVEVQPVDVTDEGALAAFLDRWRDRRAPLAGVVHAAAIGHDRPVDVLTAADLRMVMEPKLRGALALHRATLADRLDFFLLTSSVSGWTGTSGQAAYAAANAGLDAFAEWRSRQGRPTASLALGPVAEVGMAAASPEIVQYLDLLGYTPLPVDRLADVLDRATAWNRPQLGVFDVDWLRWSLAEPRAAAGDRFGTLVAAARSATGGDAGALRTALAALPPDERIETLAGLVAAELSLVLGASADDLDTDGPLHALGLDSLMVVEVQTRLNAALGAELSLMGLLGRDSIRDVARGIEEAVR